MEENEVKGAAEAPKMAVMPEGVANALAGLVSEKTLESVAKVEAKAPEAVQVSNEEVSKAPEVKKPEEEKPKATTEATTEGEDKGAEVEKKEAKVTKPEEEKKSVLGLNFKKKDKQDITIESEEDAIKALNSKFGQNLKDIKDMPKFFESAQKWRESAQKAEKLEEENTQYKGILEGLPVEMIDAIKLHYQGEDYTKALASKPKFDYAKPVDNQDIKELVNHYFPGKFTDEDFSEDEPSSALEIAISSAKDKFSVEKQAIDNKRADEAIKANKRLEAFKSSVSGSVNYLKQNFPDVTKDELQDVVSVIEGGPNAVLGFFFNKDGSVKQEAAEMLLMAKHGKSEIEKMMEVAAHQAEGRVNEELVTRGADGPRPKKTEQAQGLSEEAQRRINELGSFKDKKTY